jgi:hypothetical protein
MFTESWVLYLPDIRKAEGSQEKSRVLHGLANGLKVNFSISSRNSVRSDVGAPCASCFQTEN